MTNILAFSTRDAPLTGWKLSTYVVEPYRPLQPGELVAFQFSEGKGVMFARWEGPSGRDDRGRFVRRGSSDECTYLDIGLKFRPEAGGLRILGRVIESFIDSSLAVPRPPASA
jgi:hypothetical protein